jgi:hypothetical protein
VNYEQKEQDTFHIGAKGRNFALGMDHAVHAKA